MKKSSARVQFRGEGGKFINQQERYTSSVKSIWVFRNRRWLKVSDRKLGPKELINVLNRPEFESLAEAVVPVDEFTTRSKYKAWDISEQIDSQKGLRRKNLKLTMVLMDGKRQRKVSFYHQIKRNKKSSYGLFRRINQEIGLEGMFLYDRVGGKILADRRVKQVKLKKIIVEKVI